LQCLNPDTKKCFFDNFGQQGITSSQKPLTQPVAPGVSFFYAANDSIGGWMAEYLMV